MNGTIPENRSPQYESLSLYSFEVVNHDFFHLKNEVLLTLNGEKVYVNSYTVRLLPDVDFVKFLISRDEKKLVLKPCSANDIHSFKWVVTKNGKRYPTERTGSLFVLGICQFMGWNPDERHKILGKLITANDEAHEQVICFDLTAVRHERRTSKNVNMMKCDPLQLDRNGSFGQKYSSSQRTLHLNTFEGLTVLSIENAPANNNMESELNEEITNIPGI